MGEPEPSPTPVERLPELLDPTETYRQMGLLTERGPLGLVGTVKFLVGPPPDSMLVLVGLSLRNHGFTFHRLTDQFVAEYHVDVVLRAAGGTVAAQATRDERIVVASYRETLRSDESVIFQQFLTVPPGSYQLSVNLRDRGSANSGHLEASVTVPLRRGSALSLPLAVYQARPRRSLDSVPEMVVNPRQMAQYGADSVLFYLETYALPAGTRLAIAASDPSGQVVWGDTIRVDTLAPVIGHLIAVPSGPLSIGRFELRVADAGTTMATTPFLVSFSDYFAVANLADIVSLLRYFAPPDTLRALLRAPPSERAAAWQHFWRSTDPNPTTPENEAIEEYLQRVQQANEQFRDEGVPGWLTERGEVYITLGEPTQVLDRRSDFSTRGRYVQWSYDEYRLVLLFIDDSGFGHYRLEPRSRAEFQRVASRVRGW